MRTRSSAGRGLGGRAAATVTCVLSTLAVVGALAPPVSAVSVNQTFGVPEDRMLTVHGHGYGHGHGMSQYGARGAAERGLTHREILEFYYPGTTWGEVRGLVRVLITGDTTRDLVVSPAARLRVRDLGSATTYALPEIPGVKRWRLEVEDGRTVVDYLTDRWHRWLPEGVDGLVGDAEFRAREPLTLWTPAGPVRYRGSLRAASPAPGSADRDTVNVVSVDNYVKGVIPAEMPASWHPEAVRAQAVAARTYASWSRAENMARYHQICDTTACQVYRGVDGEHPASNAAVEATSRQILTYEGTPAFTQFSSSSGGHTSAGSRPYLVARPDPYDGHAGNPVHAWQARIDTRRLERTYPALGRLLRIRVVSRDGHGEWQGRVWSMVLDGSRADRTISGDSFRWLFGLRSSWFTFSS